MKGLRPFFMYFGGKWRAAPRYPKPRHRTIIEPFAGAAGYALRYPDRDVVLVERYEVLASVWSYLIRVTPEEIRGLPDLRHDQTVDNLDICQEARWLIGFLINAGAATPCKRLSKWARSPSASPANFWGAPRRERIASQVEAIRHWRVVHGSYEDAPDVEATWFIDPPYQVRGKDYRHSDVDYIALGAWCKTRNGQVIVCENDGADWLPFGPFISIKGTSGKRRSGCSKEVIWTDPFNTPGCTLPNRGVTR